MGWYFFTDKFTCFPMQRSLIIMTWWTFILFDSNFFVTITLDYYITLVSFYLIATVLRIITSTSSLRAFAIDRGCKSDFFQQTMYACYVRCGYGTAFSGPRHLVRSLSLPRGWDPMRIDPHSLLTLTGEDKSCFGN